MGRNIWNISEISENERGSPLGWSEWVRKKVEKKQTMRHRRGVRWSCEKTSHTADITLQFVKELIWKQHELNDIINLFESKHSHFILSFSYSPSNWRRASWLPVGVLVEFECCCYVWSVWFDRVWADGMGTWLALDSLKAHRACIRGYLACRYLWPTLCQHIFQFTLQSRSLSPSRLSCANTKRRSEILQISARQH